MNRSILLDTNIVLDMTMPERPGWAAANLLLDDIAFGNTVAYVSSHSLKNIYYVFSKYADEPTARESIKACLELFKTVSVGESICRLSVNSDEPDFEDGIVRACAEAAQVDFIVSRDENAFQTSPIRRLSAQEYVDLFCDAEEVVL